MKSIAWLFEPLYRWLTAYMGRHGLILYGLFDCDCACAAPPDYSPVANASKEAAEVMANLGREQLEESRRQYELNRETTQPIIDAQKRLMEQSYAQGEANYNRMVEQGQPLQTMMRDIALGKITPEQQRQMDEAARRALADVGTQLDLQRAATIRSMTRMGVNPNSGRMSAMQNAMDVQSASARAGAANMARQQAGDRFYGRLGDVYNTYAGLGSQAPTFYQAGTQAGHSAAANQLGISNALMGGMAQGAQTIGSGQQMQLSGLSSVLNAQTSYANAMNQMFGSMGGSGLGGLGSALGGAAQLYTAFGSDRRLKEGIELVGKDEATGLNLYEFTYIDDPDKRRFVGVMADEVEPLFPDAVSRDEQGFAAVNYGMLGIEFKEVA